MIKKDRLSVEHHLTRLSLKQQGQLRMKMDAINKQRQRTLMLLTDYKDELTPEQFQLLNEHLKAMELRELLCSTDETLKEIRNNESLTAKDRIRLIKETRDEHQIKLKTLQVNQSISTDTAFDSLLMDSIIQRENTEQVEVKTEQEQNKPLWSDGVHIPGIHPPRPKLKPRVYIDGESFVTAHNLSMIQAPPGIGKSSICESILSNVLNKDCEGLGLYVDEEVERAVFFDCERDLSLIDESNEVMLKRANIKEHNTKAIIVGLRESFSIAEKKQRIIQVVEYIKPQLIMIDGVADLVLDTNGIEHTNNAYLWLMEIIVKYDLAIIVTLHPNKGTTTARGHIGSEMLRRCEGVIEVSENIEGIRTMQVTKARRSKKTKASFKWDEDVQMMVSCDVKQGNTKKPSIIQSLSDYEIEQLKQALGFEIKHEPGKIVDKEIRVPILYKLAPIMDALKKYLKEEHPQVNTGTNNVGIFLKDLCFENKHILKNGKSPGTTYVFQNINESDLIVKSEIIE
jgi:hypothetical protein